TPNCSDSRVESATSAACSSALVGMQPTCRQVPPSLSFSTRATSIPSWAARNAQAYPPDPAPSTTTSNCLASATVSPCPRHATGFIFALPPQCSHQGATRPVSSPEPVLHHRG